MFKNGYLEDQEADIIVNAADAGIWFGDGVDGALRQRGGWDYIHACQAVSRRYAPIPTGETVFMKNRGGLKCRYVVHAVSPCWNDIMPYWMLYGMVKNMLKKCARMHIKNVVIPVLGSGAFRLCINKAYASINKAAKDTRGKTVVLIIHPDYKPDGRRTKMKNVKKLLKPEDSPSYNPNMKMPDTIVSFHKKSPKWVKKLGKKSTSPK